MRLLVVEDDALLGDAVQNGLRQAGYAADWVRDGVAADSALDAETYAALVLDLGLPKRSGLDVLRRLRNRNDHTPVLILTARDAIEDRIQGLDAGADDYLVKPFDMGELAARLRALIRRAGGQPAPMLKAQGVELDPAGHRVHYRGQAVELSAREFALLHALLLNAGRVLTRSQIEEALYAWGEEIESNTVEVYVHHLRRKLDAGLIETVRGVGYLIRKDPHD